MATLEAKAPGSALIRPAAQGGAEFGMSGKEIRALEDQIKELKVENCRLGKEIHSLKVGEEGLTHQLRAQQIETLEHQQTSDAIRTQLDQVNQVMEAFGYREQVYNELHR